MTDPLRKLALRDGRYKPEAFQFLFESLDRAVQLAGREHCEGADRHVSGQELLTGMRHYASELFGPMAGHVWRSWGIHGSIDWGNIVFLLVDEKMLNRQDDDTLDDFRENFDFQRTFVDEYVPALPKRLEARPPE